MSKIDIRLIELQVDLLELRYMGLSYEEIIGYIDFYSDLWISLTKDLTLN